MSTLDPVQIAAIPVSQLEFSTRIQNCFKNAGIETVGDIEKQTDDDLLRIRNFGLRSLWEVKDTIMALRGIYRG